MALDHLPMVAPTRFASPPLLQSFLRCYECGRGILGPLDGGAGPVEATVMVAQLAAQGVRYVRQQHPFHARCLARRTSRHRRRSRVVLAVWLAAAVALAAAAWWTGTTPLVGLALAVPGGYAAWLEATEIRATAPPHHGGP
jgi:hypothetical protein